MSELDEFDDLVNRLRGVYRIPIKDGLGPAGGDEPNNPDVYVRHFEVSPIAHEVAAAVEKLIADRDRWRDIAKGAEVVVRQAQEMREKAERERDQWRDMAAVADVALWNDRQARKAAESQLADMTRERDEARAVAAGLGEVLAKCDLRQLPGVVRLIGSAPWPPEEGPHKTVYSVGEAIKAKGNGND